MATRNLTKAFLQARSGGKANRSLLKQEDGSGLSMGSGLADRDRDRHDSDQGSDSGLLNSDGVESTWKVSRVGVHISVSLSTCLSVSLSLTSTSLSHTQAQKEALPPLWVDTLESTEEAIQSIVRMTRELNQMHTQRLMVNFEVSLYICLCVCVCVCVCFSLSLSHSPPPIPLSLTHTHTHSLTLTHTQVDEEELEQRVAIKTSEITEVFRRAENMLHRFGHQGDEDRISDSERTVRRNMQSQVARKLQQLSSTFRSSQKGYLKKVRVFVFVCVCVCVCVCVSLPLSIYKHS